MSKAAHFSFFFWISFTTSNFLLSRCDLDLNCFFYNTCCFVTWRCDFVFWSQQPKHQTFCLQGPKKCMISSTSHVASHFSVLLLWSELWSLSTDYLIMFDIRCDSQSFWSLRSRVSESHYWLSLCYSINLQLQLICRLCPGLWQRSGPLSK